MPRKPSKDITNADSAGILSRLSDKEGSAKHIERSKPETLNDKNISDYHEKSPTEEVYSHAADYDNDLTDADRTILDLLRGNDPNSNDDLDEEVYEENRAFLNKYFPSEESPTDYEPTENTNTDSNSAQSEPKAGSESTSDPEGNEPSSPRPK